MQFNFTSLGDYYKYAQMISSSSIIIIFSYTLHKRLFLELVFRKKYSVDDDDDDKGVSSSSSQLGCYK